MNFPPLHSPVTIQACTPWCLNCPYRHSITSFSVFSIYSHFQTLPTSSPGSRQSQETEGIMFSALVTMTKYPRVSCFILKWFEYYMVRLTVAFYFNVKLFTLPKLLARSSLSQIVIWKSTRKLCSLTLQLKTPARKLFVCCVLRAEVLFINQHVFSFSYLFFLNVF